jgi:hypothetical protein
MDVKGDHSEGAQFSKYSMCMYEIFNPYPDHTLYINVYRQTNNSDIGIYFEKSRDVPEAVAKKSPLLPRGYKESIHEYVPGEWKANATIPVETTDYNSYFQTFKV